MDINREIGKKIREQRIAQNISREFLASQIGVSLDTIGNYERGATAMTIPKLIATAKALDMDPGALISETRSTMLWKYEKLSPRHKEAIREMVDVCYNEQRHQLPYGINYT